MSSAKRKRSRKKKKRHKKKKRRTSSPGVEMFEEGDYVRWSTPGNGGDLYNEGRVIRDTGEIVQVLQASEFVLNLGGQLRSRVVKTNWRDFVEVGSFLELSCKTGWLQCKVRGIQGECENARKPRVVVVEPLFYGSTLSVPLKSLSLRRPSCLDRDLQTIIQTGFGFNSACACPATWAPYNPRGSFDGGGGQTEISLARFTEAPQDFCFVLSPPCLLPDGICFVRSVRGELKFVKKSSISVVHTLPPLEEHSTDLGCLEFPLAKAEGSFKDHEGLVIPCVNAYEIAQDFFDHGDPSSAATMLRDHSEDFPRKELVESLLVMSGKSQLDKPGLVHPVSRLVWQHSMMHRLDYARGDLSCLQESLARIMSTRFIPSRYYLELQRLRNQVSIWSIYAKQWGMARQLQNEKESHYPVNVRLDELTKTRVRFSASVVTPLVPVDLTTTGILSWGAPPFLTTQMGTILEAFTPTSLRVFGEEESVFDQSNWMSEVRRISTVQPGSTIASRLFDRERTAVHPINELLTREAVTPSGEIIRWNTCQGPLRNEDLDETSAFPPCSAGGIVVVPCNKKRVLVVSQLLSQTVLGEHHHDPPTLIITAPTLLHFWKQELESRGISCYTYHGTNRRARAPDAITNKKVFITTTQVFIKWEDLSFFVNAEPRNRVQRLIMDTNTIMKSPCPRVLDGISRLGCKYLWMLESKPEKDHLAIALALLNIRPFAKQSGWGTDLVSDFRRREFVQNLLYSERTPNEVTKKLVHFLVETVYNCASVDAQLNRTLSEDSLWCRHSNVDEPRSDREIALLAAVKAKLWKSMGDHVPLYALPTEQQFRKKWEQMIQISWGMQVPVSAYGELVAYGHFQIDPSFFEIYTDKWETDEANAIEKDAAVKLKKLLDYKPIEGNCPICMDPLHSGNRTPCDGGNALSASVAVGTCGHMLCGECADQIYRVAEENRASGENDYGAGDNSVNHARCPLCRIFWEKDDNPPLLLPTIKNVVLGGGDLKNSAVYKVLPARGNTYAEARQRASDDAFYTTPLLGLLEGILANIRQTSSNKRVAILCKTSGLAEHLEKYSNFEGTTRAVSLHSRRTVDSRGNAIKSFNDPSNDITEIYISTSLVGGLTLDGVRNFVFADRVLHRQLDDITEFMASCCRETLSSNPGFVPVVHTIASDPLSWGKEGGERRPSATVLLSEPTAGKTLRDLVPLVPESGWDYIQKFHDLFDKPTPPRLTEGYYPRSAEVVPIQISEEPPASEINPEWSPPREGAVPDQGDDLVEYLTQAETDEILSAGLPLPDAELTATSSV